tara:strand:- start:467 stop:940 length:474 start_codon:yes stop_codon:yes gene_type:complete
MINEHDITKKILESIRNKEHIGKPLLNEETITHAQAIGDDEPDVAKEETSEEPTKIETDYPAEFNDDSKIFMDQVTPRVDFTLYNIYPDSNEVEFKGKLYNGIEWQFKKSNKWAYINADNLELDDINVELIKSINTYFQNWMIKWAKEDLNQYRGNE